MEERTQAELAYKELSHRILIQEIGPNERIKEQFWSQQLNVNRAAIRETLTRLLGEGIVRRGERGGYFVTEMSKEDIHEIREVREILETGAFVLACDHVTPKQLRDLEETCKDFANFFKKRYFTGAHEADLRFHQSLIEASNNSRLIQLYHRSHIPLFQRKVAIARIQEDEFVRTEEEHRKILDALKRKDKKNGVQYLKDHFNRGEKDATAED